MFYLRLLCALAVACCLLVSSPALAQTATSIIHGNVRDDNGAALVNAAVTATLTGANSVYRAVTNADGNYIIPGVRPGQYTISFDLPGFRKTERAGVRLEVSQQARVDMVMEVGEVRGVVTVNADASMVETSNATLKTVVDSRRMVDLPLNGRQALQLQALTPGAVQVNTGQAASLIALNTGLSFSINGARPNASSYYLDGGINMDMYNNLATAFPNPDALQDFSVQANNFSAVHGRNAGGVINMVTKSGTNDYHGTLYEFLRNDVLNTRNFFSLTKPTLRRNQYGGTIGGPLRLPKQVFGPLNYEGRDRTFFFFSFEGMRERHLLDQLQPAALEFVRCYTRPAGTLIWVAVWPGMDGSDDGYESFYNFPLYYALGGPDEMNALSRKLWDGRFSSRATVRSTRSSTLITTGCTTASASITEAS